MPTTPRKRITLRVHVTRQIHYLIVALAEEELRTYHDQAKFLMLQGLGWRPMPSIRPYRKPDPNGNTTPIPLRLTADEREALHKIAAVNYRSAEDMAAYAIAKALNCTHKDNAND